MKASKFWAWLAPRIAPFAASALCMVLFVCANTNSCCLIHQPKTPEGLDQFSKVR